MWTEGNYRRVFLDMHIDDWNEDIRVRIVMLPNADRLARAMEDMGDFLRHHKR